MGGSESGSPMKLQSRCAELQPCEGLTGAAEGAAHLAWQVDEACWQEAPVSHWPSEALILHWLLARAPIAHWLFWSSPFLIGY